MDKILPWWWWNEQPVSSWFLPSLLAIILQVLELARAQRQCCSLKGRGWYCNCCTWVPSMHVLTSAQIMWSSWLGNTTWWPLSMQIIPIGDWFAALLECPSNSKQRNPRRSSLPGWNRIRRLTWSLEGWDGTEWHPWGTKEASKQNNWWQEEL